MSTEILFPVYMEISARMVTYRPQVLNLLKTLDVHSSNQKSMMTIPVYVVCMWVKVRLLNMRFYFPF